MSTEEKPMYSWRQCVISSDLAPTTRHVLITLSMHMDVWGDNCYPTIDQIMYETGLGRTSVIKHLSLAVELGWLRKAEHGFRGRQWRNHQYFPEVPAGATATPWKRSEQYLKAKESKANQKTRTKILSSQPEEFIDQTPGSNEKGLIKRTDLTARPVDKSVDNLCTSPRGGSPRDPWWFTSRFRVVREVNPSSSLSNSISSSVTNDLDLQKLRSQEISSRCESPLKTPEIPEEKRQAMIREMKALRRKVAHG